MDWTDGLDGRTGRSRARTRTANSPRDPAPPKQGPQKIYDNTKKEREEYSNTSKLIAEELNYIIKNLVNPI